MFVYSLPSHPMKCGIIGLPNVGKSTLFNALTQTSSAQAANYPFCTIEPNTGTVCVPDARLSALVNRDHSALAVPTVLEFVDIAGLVKGASQGEGLGNQFLGHIREVDLLIHVVRCFEDSSIIHVNDRVHPLDDISIIETELLLADLQSVEKRLASKKHRAQELLLLKIQGLLQSGKWLSTITWDDKDLHDVQSLQLLTTKPIIYVCNISESQDLSHPLVISVQDYARSVHSSSVVLCNELEAQLSQLDASDRVSLLDSLNLSQTGLDVMVQTSYKVLDLVTFFTSGPKEVRAWTITKGTKAPEAAGVIHTDFQKGFIRAEVVSYSDYIAYPTDASVRDAGKLRLEGKDYIVQDGDVMHFRHAN